MKRDMDLCRKILFKIEELYDSTAIYNLEIEGYTRSQVAYHSNLLYEAGLISDYKAQYADNEIYSFGVSSLTWDGHDFLDKIREDTTWNKVKDIIKNKALPMTLDVIKTVATGVITATLKSLF
jgi:DNA-binding transcriptional ArsR family regulator